MLNLGRTPGALEASCTQGRCSCSGDHGNKNSVEIRTRPHAPLPPKSLIRNARAMCISGAHGGHNSWATS